MTDGRTCLQIASVGCEGDPRATIVGPQGRETNYAIFGRGGRDLYGNLQPTDIGASLWVDGQNVMHIHVTNEADLRMSAVGPNGVTLVNAGRSLTTPGNGPDDRSTWKVQVRPAVDAVLVMACMLTIITLERRPRGSAAASPLNSTRNTLMTSM
eukprot:4054034-Amphidinium_carterae.1